MYRKLLDYFSHDKYRLMIFFLLAGATIVSVAVWRVRSEYSGTVHYAFLIWNLFLAWIPFIIAYFTYTLTDFQHLAGSPGFAMKGGRIWG